MPRRRPEIPLFALVFGAYAYFYQAGGWNQNSRFDLTRAIVEGHTVAIDAFHLNTGDKAQRGPHWYSDKAPGLSLLAVPAYALVHAVRGPDVVAGSYLATLLAVALPSAVAVVHVFLAGGLLGLGARPSAAVAAAYGLATLAWPYSTLFYGHQTAAALAFIAFVVLWRQGPAVVAGLLLGVAVAADYTALVAAVLVTAYAFARRGARGAAGVVLGGLPAAAVLAAYHAAAFGHPLALPYHFVLQDHRRMGWFMGIAAPDPVVLWELVGGAYRGLFYGAPWLLAGLPGVAVLYRRGHRAEALACAAALVAYLLLNASLVDWAGGWAMGPRYLVPAIPFLAVGAMGVLLALPSRPAARRLIAAAGIAAVAASAVLMLAGTAVRPDVPLTIRRPFQQYLLPSLRQGRVSRSNHPIDGEGVSGLRAAWNLGHLAGLDRLSTLIPLALWIAATGGWLGREAAEADRRREARA